MANLVGSFRRWWRWLPCFFFSCTLNLLAGPVYTDFSQKNWCWIWELDPRQATNVKHILTSSAGQFVVQKNAHHTIWPFHVASFFFSLWGISVTSWSVICFSFFFLFLEVGDYKVSQEIILDWEKQCSINDLVSGNNASAWTWFGGSWVD